MKEFNFTKKITTLGGGTILCALFVLYILSYFQLDRNLHSIYDEGFFYTILQHDGEFVADTQPLSLGVNFAKSVFPFLDGYDVYQLRVFNFWIIISAILLTTISSIFLFVKRFGIKGKAIGVLIIANLLMGLFVLPETVFNMNTELTFLVSISLSLSCFALSIRKQWAQYLLFSLSYFFAFFAILCNTPGAGMFISLLTIFLVLIGGIEKKNLIQILGSILTGFVLGFVVMHCMIISCDDLIAYLQKALQQTSTSDRASHHSLSKVILVILFSIRDLLMGVTTLYGVTYLCKLTKKHTNRNWLSISVGIILLGILLKYMVKPSLTYVTLFTWILLMSVEDLNERKSLTRENWVVIIFLYLLPLGLSFGTNTSILGKALGNILPWGMLCAYIYYLQREDRVYKTAICILMLALTIMFSGSYKAFSQFNNKSHSVYFLSESPIKSMRLSQEQYAFYSEVYETLKHHDYEIGKDTLLGFCFNEMTVVAMDAIPYTNDQQPEEFLKHDLLNLPRPKYMILSEWDTTVLNCEFKKLDWDFPNAYEEYDVVSNPDPNSGYNLTQSIIYCIKKEFL